VDRPATASSASESFAVLIVDDNSAKRLALKAALAPLGCPVVEADSGLAALRCVLVRDFAVILLDVRMPAMDGFETAARIRQRSQSEFTPIIFITAFGRDEIVPADRYAEGAVDFIFAPVEPDVLRAKVSAFGDLFKISARLASSARQSDASTSRLLVLMDSLPIGIFQTDSDNRYTYTNARWSEMTGISSEEATGRQLGNLGATVESAERQSFMAKLVAGDRGEFSHRFTMRLKGEGPRAVVANLASIEDPDGRAAGWVGTIAEA
jgi:PAS domain S-box-containing protein